MRVVLKWKLSVKQIKEDFEMNKAILMGRATADPSITYSGELAIASYTLAVDRRRKKDSEETADFIKCKAFGHNAEFAEKYVRKGTKLLVEGRIQTGSYTNKDGQKVYTTDVMIDSQEFAESKGESKNNDSETKADTGFMDIPDGIEAELPFN